MRKGICVAGNMIVDILYPIEGWPAQGGLAERHPGEPAGDRVAPLHVRHHTDRGVLLRAGREGRLPGGVHDEQHPAEPPTDLLQRGPGAQGRPHPLRGLLYLRLRGRLADPAVLQREGQAPVQQHAVVRGLWQEGERE